VIGRTEVAFDLLERNHRQIQIFAAFQEITLDREPEERIVNRLHPVAQFLFLRSESKQSISSRHWSSDGRLSDMVVASVR